MSPAELAFMDEELPRMQREGIIEASPYFPLPSTAPPPPTPGSTYPTLRGLAPPAFASIFSVPKTPPERRFILNCSGVNDLLECPSFRMDTLKDLLPLLRRNAWMTTVDLSSAFSHVLMDPVTRPLLTFKFRGRHFQFRALPFGLNSAPRTFTMMLKPVLAHLRKTFPGLVTQFFIDDGILAHRSKCVVHRATQELLDLLGSLGFQVNSKKSSLSPSHSVTYLGFILNTSTRTVSLPPSKVRSLRRTIADWQSRITAASLSGAPLPSIRALGSLVGRLNAVRPAVPHALLFSGALQRTKTLALRSPATRGNWDAAVPTTLMAGSAIIAAELSWWASLLGPKRAVSAPMTPPPPTLLMETDASGRGGGFVIRLAPPGSTTTTLPQVRESLPIVTQAGWFWPLQIRTSSRSICDLELRAVVWAVKAAAKTIAGHSILLLTDNFATSRYAEKGRGKVELLSQLTRDLHVELERAGVRSLQVQHLAGKLNRDADRLSRGAPDKEDWKLNPAVFRHASSLWGTPSIDLFATPANTQIPDSFYSKDPAPGSLGVDSFQHLWAGGGLPPRLLWANPPYENRLISRMLDKIIREKARVAVALPWWPTAPWFAPMLDFVVSGFKVPRGTPGLFLPGHLGSGPPSGPSRWPTLVALLSGAPSVTRGSLDLKTWTPTSDLSRARTASISREAGASSSTGLTRRA
jgi:hypothetical protein